MTVIVERLDNNEIKLDINIGSEATMLEYDKACQKLSRNVNIPGFRPGKAPKSLVEKYVGVLNIEREVLNGLLPTIFEKTIDENKFDIITQPNVEFYEFSEDKSLKVTAKFELKPEIKLCDYKNMEIEVEEFKSPDNALDNELKILADKFAELKDITDRKSTNTDLVNIDFTGYVDGEQIKGGAAKNYLLDLAHSNFIPGFAEQLVEHATGEEFKIQVKFPDEYHDEKLKGKDAEFNIKLNSIKEKVLPEINDDLAKKAGQFDTLDALKEDISKYLERAVKSENDKRVADKIYEKLINTAEVEIQKPMIQREAQALLGEFKQRVAMQGGNFDEMLEKEGHEKIYAQLETEAIQRIKTSLVINKIARDENIYVENADLDKKILELCAMYHTTRENIIAEIQKNFSLLTSMQQQVLSQKVTSFLLEKAKVNYINK